jgi:hypothetical protein
MIYAQIRAGRKMHIACEPGEEWKGEVVRKGYLSAPICGQPMKSSYRMTCNLPLANACKKCRAALNGL